MPGLHTAADRAQAFRDAFLHACALDVHARKPGNVSTASPGHRMTADDFLRSAAAAAAPLAAPGARTGARIEAAIVATRAAVGCNTNLGIVLLCAPIARAWERCDAIAARGDAPPLRAALEAELAALDLEDARGAYRAIALAQPAGLGRAPREDIADAPTLDLRAAMALAAGRDRIAAQYAGGFADVFEAARTAWGRDDASRPGLARSDPEAARETADVRAMQRTFLAFLSAAPDSHIVRKHGDALAQTVMAEAAPWHARAASGDDVGRDPAFAAWDESLKSRGLNPGTSADLCVAAALVAALSAPPERDSRASLCC